MPGTPTLLSLTVGLAIVSAIFWVLERHRPSLRQQRRQPGETRLDLAYWFFTPLVTRAAATRQTWASSLPLWIQVPLILLLADLLAYWTHRLFHARWLWPFHAVHHSSRTVDWLSSVRLHPVNDAAARIAQALPLYWLGFNGVVLAAFVPFLTFYALLLHANVRWNYGPLRYVFASPTFHRWHHTTEAEGLDTNFAGMFPFIDLAFGTFYMPAGREPQHFGIVGDDMPGGLLGQLAYPFRGRETRARERMAR